MKAMVLRRPGVPLPEDNVAIPEPAPTQVLVRVNACAVCRTGLHLIEGESPNLMRADGEEFFSLAAKFHITTHVERFPLEQANEALSRLKSGRITGAGVL